MSGHRPERIDHDCPLTEIICRAGAQTSQHQEDRMTSDSQPPEHTKMAELLFTRLTGPKKDRMTLEDVDFALAELVEDAEERSYRQGELAERSRPRPNMGWLAQHAAIKLGPQDAWTYDLSEDADHENVLRAMIEELADWRRFDRAEQNRISRLGEQAKALIAGIRLLAKLAGQGQSTHMIGEKGATLGMGAVLAGIASELQSLLLHEIQHPRWRNEGGNKPPEDGVAKFITRGGAK